MMDRIRTWVSDEKMRGRLLRWFWLISLLMLLLGYTLIVMRLL
jgi:hypothetical protein